MAEWLRAGFYGGMGASGVLTAQGEWVATAVMGVAAFTAFWFYVRTTRREER